MKCRAVTTIHDATCGRCCGPATLAMAGEEFHGGRCKRCGLILIIDRAVYRELVRRVRSGQGRAPRRCWLVAAVRWLLNLSKRNPQ